MGMFLASRKARIRKNGGLQLGMPKSFLINIKAEYGQDLRMFLDDKNQFLIVRKV